MSKPSLFTELRKRKVVQVAAIYVAVAWGVTEIVVTVVEQLFLPQWVATLAVIGFVVGFPVAMFLSWIFDITSKGIQRTEVTSRRGTASIALSLLLLVAGTTSLFLLIKPSIQEKPRREEAPAVVPNSVAVLPFENAGDDESDAYLSTGLSDELRGQLGRVMELRVAARSSSVAAVERGMDATTASSSLRVAHLVEGSMRRQGKRLRVSVQLIEGRSGLAVWSGTYDRDSRELLSVQQTIADEIVSRVLPDAEGIVTAPATRDASANELMLLAQYYESQVRSRQEVDRQTLLEAIRLYGDATRADPESALAHSRLAGALLYLGDVDAAEDPINRALALDPNLSEVQNTVGEFYWARGQPNAVTAFQRAVELNPNSADALHNLAYQLWMKRADTQSHKPQTEELFRRAMEIDTLSLVRHAALGEFFGGQGRAAEVRPVIRNIERLFDDAEAFRAIGWLYELTGEVDLAIAWTLRARDLEPDNPDHVSRLAGLFALIGDVDTATQLESKPSAGVLYHLRRYEELIDVAQDRVLDEPNDAEVRYLLAFAYVATDQFDLAMHVLRSTDLPDSVLEDRIRSATEGEAFQTLINAMFGSGLPEAVEVGRSLAEWQEDFAWWGDVGWIGLYRACNYSVLGKHEEALEFLPLIKDSVRLRREPELRDSWCFRRYQDEPAYQDVLRDQEARRAELRARLPATLKSFGVSL